ncbi:hypothetical protein [Companilactobacillus ginsenosidimutans]|uniref:Lipoprotein n=1 Tax=Companilactobacillus ginsenosidimutans TaxID=1007676 RepID=A0A0H4QGS8_9LACO|nr:hypothetical protein [Companilactobacillus ginsenosidimutans]AKP67614.1 hypothetical protein ABM34_08775 [Companilactobacillus ginsenosidimutans]
MKKLLASVLVGGLALTVVGCSNTSNNSSSQGSKTGTSQTYSNTWKSGVPSQYKGYYGRDTDAFGEKTFEPVKFLDNEMTYGLGDAMLLKHVEYKQIAEDTFIIHGSNNQYDTNNSDIYLKLVFKKTDGKTSLGMASDKTGGSAISSFSKTKKLSTKGMTWYNSYSKADFERLSGQSTSSDDQSSSSSDSETSSKSSSNSSDGTKSISDSDYSGKIFWQKDSPLYIVFGDPGNNGMDNASTFSMYNVHDDGAAYQTAWIKNAEVVTDGDTVTFRSSDGNNDGAVDQDQTFQRLSSTQLKRRETGEVYTLYSGSPKSLGERINNELGLPRY